MEPTEDTTAESGSEAVFELSDESFLEMSVDDLDTTEKTEEDAEEEEDIEEENTDETDDSDDTSEDTENTDDEDASDGITEDSNDTANEADSDETDTAETDTEEETDEKEVETSVDYKAEYEKLVSPFKANGAQMQVDNVEDAITLMKMGANYHKKMAGLKPSLKVVKLLEKNNLLDPEKISYLIDLHTKDPAAIAKLVKDSGINPLEMDVDEDTNYKPTNRSVTDNEIDIDNVLEDIKSTPTYSKTMNVITEQWDDDSRSLIADAPHIISLINEHMADGTYDAITAVVTRERSLGRLQGASDLAAYKAVGDIMHSNYQLPGQIAPKAAPSKIKPKTTSGVSDVKRKKMKKAASSTKSVKSNTAKLKDMNPLAMSDEDFAKISEAQF